MSIRTPVQSALVRQLVVLATAVLVAVSPLVAGHNNFRGNNVGGVSIDTNGVLAQPDPESRKMLLQQLRQDVKKPVGDLGRPVELRMVSLKGLEAALKDAVENKLGHLPDEVRYLAGLQRIQYVFVYPEENDIVLAGPGEGWKIREDATVVGMTTDRPVIQLDDLLVAFRTAKDAARQSISVSIDPTEEGREKLDALMAEMTRRRATFTPAVPEMYAKALGPQRITLTGVPADSHLARVLVAADYRMKRIAMHLDPSPVKDLPSFLEMQQKNRSLSQNMMPRWWLACNYEPLAKAEDGLAWELRGPGVKCMTEDEFVEGGKVVGTGKVNPVAQKWADTMTAKYDELAKKDGVFGELRNVMDLCVIAALIEKEGLLEKANLALPTIMNSDSELTHEPWNTPKTVATQSSFLKVGREYIVTASGGVEVTSWEVASKSEVSADVKKVRDEHTAPTGKTWWAN
jgi:hypothetical protein